MKPNRLLRDTLVILLVSICIAVSVEALVRLTMNERVKTVYADGIPLAQEDSILGYRHNPGAQARHFGPEYAVDYRISEQGFRDPVVYPATADQGKIRVLLIGDSYTFGHGVQYEESWAALIREYFKRNDKPVEIINSAVQGYSTTQQVLYLESLLNQYQPKIVVIGFVAHDLITNRPIDETGSVAKIAEGAVGTVDGAKKSSLHSVFLLKRLLASNDYLYTQAYINTDRRKWYAQPPSPWLVDQIDITKTLLSRAARLCRQNNARLVVFSMPQLFQVLVEANGTGIEGVDVGSIDRTFLTFAAAEGFKWIPALSGLATTYSKGGKDLYFRIDGHFNSAGNEVFAGIAFEALSAAVRDLAP